MKGASIGLLVAVTLLLLAIPGVQAKAVETPFLAALNVIEGVPAQMWVDDDGIRHIRGLPFPGIVIGDIFGEAYLRTNSNIDTATGNGTGFGNFTFSDVTWAGLSGDFAGRYSGTFTEWTFSGEFVGRGSEDFEDMKIRGTVNQIPTTSVFILDGIILNPHG